MQKKKKRVPVSDPGFSGTDRVIVILYRILPVSEVHYSDNTRICPDKQNTCIRIQN
jgi:hypothetical protein